MAAAFFSFIYLFFYCCINKNWVLLLAAVCCRAFALRDKWGGHPTGVALRVVLQQLNFSFTLSLSQFGFFFLLLFTAIDQNYDLFTKITRLLIFSPLVVKHRATHMIDASIVCKSSSQTCRLSLDHPFIHRVNRLCPKY